MQFLIKALSGRYVLTLICGFVFAYCSWKKIIPADAIIAILSMVFISYFQRSDRRPDIADDTAQTTTTSQTTTKLAETE